MCKRHIEEETTPEGVIKTTTLLTKCETANATGQICGTQSGITSAQSSPPPSNATHLSPQFARLDQFPPTPPRSTHSNSDSEQSSRRRSDSHGGSTVYSGTSASYEVNRSSPTRRERRDSYYDESPQTPLSRSPGRSEDSYRESRRSRRGSVASSDRERVSSSHHSRRSSSHSRPRPTSLRVEIVDASPNKPNTRTPRHSRQSSRDGSDTSEDMSIRRREEYYRREEEERAQKEMRAKIARQNQAINSRPAAPVSAPPSSAPKPRSSTKQDKYRRGSVAFDAQADLNSSLQRLQIKEDKEIRRQKREEEKRAAQEQEAREQRLRDRMNINSKRRTSTVVRPTVTMDDPRYAVPPPPQYQRPRGTR